MPKRRMFSNRMAAKPQSGKEQRRKGEAGGAEEGKGEKKRKKLPVKSVNRRRRMKRSLIDENKKNAYSQGVAINVGKNLELLQTTVDFVISFILPRLEGEEDGEGGTTQWVRVMAYTR